MTERDGRRDEDHLLEKAIVRVLGNARVFGAEPVDISLLDGYIEYCERHGLAIAPEVKEYLDGEGEGVQLLNDPRIVAQGAKRYAAFRLICKLRLQVGRDDWWGWFRWQLTKWRARTRIRAGALDEVVQHVNELMDGIRVCREIATIPTIVESLSLGSERVSVVRVPLILAMVNEGGDVWADDLWDEVAELPGGVAALGQLEGAQVEALGMFETAEQAIAACSEI